MKMHKVIRFRPFIAFLLTILLVSCEKEANEMKENESTRVDIYFDNTFCQIIVDSTVGLDLKAVNIFPNPGSERILIESESMINNFSIMDMQGKVVHGSIVNFNYLEINVDFFSGMYIFHLKTEYGEINAKVRIFNQ